MRFRHAHAIPATVAAVGFAGCLMLAACSNGAAATRPASPATGTRTGTGTGEGAGQVTDAATAAPAESRATAAATATSAAVACALVAEQEVSTALGTDPGAGTPFSSHGSSQCQFGSYQTSFVLVNLTPSGGRAAYDLVHAHQKAGSTHDVDAHGLGDRAFETTGPGTTSIYVDKADALVLVMVEIRSATSPPTDQALALARTAAARL